MQIIPLVYSATNTYAIHSDTGCVILIDTGYAGTLHAFYKAIKAAGITLEQISFIMATHYHPDHIGLIPTLMDKGVKLVVAETQLAHLHYPDPIYARETHLGYKPIENSRAKVIPVGDSRDFLGGYGISGEIVSVPSHSPDSIAVVLDDGIVIAGDLMPFSCVDKASPRDIRDDWNRLLGYEFDVVYYGHAPATRF